MNLSTVETQVIIKELAKREEPQAYGIGQYQNHQVSIESKFNGKREKIELPEHGQVLIVSLPN
jgi:hypothetical protein